MYIFRKGCMSSVVYTHLLQWPKGVLTVVKCSQDDSWRGVLSAWSSFFESNSIFTADSLEYAQILWVTLQEGKRRHANIQMTYSELSRNHWVTRNTSWALWKLTDVLLVTHGQQRCVKQGRDRLWPLDWGKGLCIC